MPTGYPGVDFIIGGAQKCGTSALNRYIADRPGLHIDAQEIHFFDDEARIDWRAPDYDLYHQRVGGAASLLRGDDTPIYLYWPNCLERIKAYSPAVKLIFLFRDPVERAWSHWRMEYVRGHETRPFAWCIREGRERLAASDTPGFHRHFSYVERGFYASQLQRAYAQFDPDQILVLLSSDLRQDPTAAVTRVCRFLGVAEPARPVEHRLVLVGVEADYGEPISADDVRLLRGLYRAEIDGFADLTGLDVGAWHG